MCRPRGSYDLRPVLLLALTHPLTHKTCLAPCQRRARQRRRPRQNFGLSVLGYRTPYCESLSPTAYDNEVDLSPLLKREHVRSDEYAAWRV